MPGALKVTPAMMRPARTFLPMSTFRSRSAGAWPAWKCSDAVLPHVGEADQLHGMPLARGAPTSATSHHSAPARIRTDVSRGTYSAS